jgi:hypothetical protein
MQFLSEVTIYPMIALLSAGLLFMHVSLRSNASLLSFLSFSLVVVFHQAVSLPDVAEIFLVLTFCISFFVSATSVPSKRLVSQSTISMSSRSLWIFTTISLALSLFSAIWYHQLAIYGGERPTIADILVALALISLTTFILAIGVLVRRRTNARVGA